MEPKNEIKSLLEEILRFRNERDWEKFHDAKNLAINLSVESSELLEAFLWKNNEEVDLDKVKEELADVLYSAFLLADKYDLNISQIIRDKLKKNALKYPVSKSKGSKKKYNEL